MTIEKQEPITPYESTLTPEGIRRQELNNLHEGIHVAMPAVIKRYNRGTHMALVHFAVGYKDAKGEVYEYQDEIVTVIRPFAGDWLIDIPLKEGDTGWVIAGDRNAFKCKLSEGSNVKDDTSTDWLYNKLSFGFFIPDKWGERFVQGEKASEKVHPETTNGLLAEDFDPKNEKDEDDAVKRMVIQSADGRQRISIGYKGEKSPEGNDSIRVFSNTSVSMFIGGYDTAAKEFSDENLDKEKKFHTKVVYTADEKNGGTTFVESTHKLTTKVGKEEEQKVTTVTQEPEKITTECDVGGVKSKIEQTNNNVKIDCLKVEITEQNTEVYIKGNTKIDGTLQVKGNISTEADVKTAAVASVNAHVHTGCQGGTTGGPVG